MLPDFRFVLGAGVAIALLGVAGLGLVTSVRLVREAHMGPLDDSRSLAFAGHAEWNQFYDPEAARRFAGLSGKTESPVTEAPAPEEAQAPKEAQAPAQEQVPAPAGPQEHTASVPVSRIQPSAAPPMTETPTVVTMLAPPAEATDAATPEPPGADAPGASATEADPPASERVASAPAASPAPDVPQETAMPAPAPPRMATQEPTAQEAPTPTLITAQPQAADAPPPGSASTPRAHPKAHFRRKVARLHIRHVARVVQQPQQNQPFPTTNMAWPGYNDTFNGAPAAWKTTGKLTGTPANRPQ